MNYQSGGDRQELSMNVERREQYLRDTKEEESRIRDMKKSLDYKCWLELRKSIEQISRKIEHLEDDLGELNWRRNCLEDKMLNEYNIKIYTKYGLFRSKRYDNI